MAKYRMVVHDEHGEEHQCYGDTRPEMVRAVRSCHLGKVEQLTAQVFDNRTGEWVGSKRIDRKNIRWRGRMSRQEWRNIA